MNTRVIHGGPYGPGALDNIPGYSPCWRPWDEYYLNLNLFWRIYTCNNDHAASLGLKTVCDMVSLHRCVDEVFIVYKSPEDFRQYTNVHTVRSMTRLPFQLEKNPLQPFREQKVKKKKTYKSLLIFCHCLKHQISFRIKPSLSGLVSQSTTSLTWI